MAHFLYALISSNIDRFSNLFHCQNLENVLNNAIIKISPHLKFVATLPCEMLVSYNQQLKTRQLLNYEHLYFTKHGSTIYMKKRKTTKMT